MNKKGQFFLIAAMVIIAILLSIGVVYNKARVQKEDTKVYDISNEFNYEGAKIIDSGIFNSLSDQQILSNLTFLASSYADANTDSQFLLVFGNASHITVVNYTSKDLGCASLSGVETCQEIREITNIEFPTSQENINITLSGNIYSFDLTSGRNFYMIIKKTKLNETFVATS